MQATAPILPPQQAAPYSAPVLPPSALPSYTTPAALLQGYGRNSNYLFPAKSDFQIFIRIVQAATATAS